MKVYTLERRYDYEGCDIEGVFRTRKQAEKARDESQYSPDDWVITEWQLPPTRNNKQRAAQRRTVAQ